MNSNLITPIEQVTPGYWWVRSVYRCSDSKPPMEHQEAKIQKGAWAIAEVEGMPPFCRLSRFFTGETAMRQEYLHNPDDIEFGRKIEEMPNDIGD